MDFVVLDFETTGLSPGRHDRVVEVGLVRLGPDGRVVEEWDSLLNPGRDVGPTSIHGITASEVNGAPYFEEVVGDLLEFIDGAVLVGHNIWFDIRFLEAELRRCGLAIPEVEGLCTMELVYAIEPDAPRQLGACCAHLGLPSAGAHQALSDARMSAALLRVALERWRYPALPKPLRVPFRPASTGKRKRRGETPQITATQGEYLARLVARLPPSAPLLCRAAESAQYLNLVDRVVEDRRVTATEAEELLAGASRSGLGQWEVELLHRHYVQGLVLSALEDGVLSLREEADLDAVSTLLNVDDWRSLMQATLAPLPPPDPAGRVGSLSFPLTGEATSARFATLPEGTSVCFTGEMRLLREEMEQIAQQCGLVVKSGVSRKVHMLVVGDPETQSGKARKARELGVRIVSDAAFLRMVRR
jgi:DNA polymerase-3 subunit epsilon